MLWEMLVTDGHVRAARLRRLQPWIIALGIVLIWLGIWIVRLGPDLVPGVSAQQKIQERLMKLGQQVEFTVQKLPAAQVAPEAAKQLPSAKEVAEVIAAVTKSLNDSGDLPDDDIKFTEAKNEDAFWKGDWPLENVVYLRDGPNLLVGGLVSVGSPSYPQPARWLGLFHRGEIEKGEKKGDKVWTYASLSANNVGFAPREFPYVAAGQVPMSLAPFLLEPPPPPKTSQPQ
jgi:hypothetical protein